jgi:hypothetical protein
LSSTLKRNEERRAAGKKAAREKPPKFGGELLQNLFMASVKRDDKEQLRSVTMPAVLKVKSTRYRNRTIVVGSTVFKFDGDGIAAVSDSSNARVDYETCSKMLGMSKVTDDETVATAPPPPAPVAVSAELPPEQEEKFIAESLVASQPDDMDAAWAEELATDVVEGTSSGGEETSPEKPSKRRSKK